MGGDVNSVNAWNNLHLCPVDGPETGVEYSIQCICGTWMIQLIICDMISFWQIDLINKEEIM